MTLQEWEEVKWLALTKVKGVEEMVPTPASNQIAVLNPTIGEEQYAIIEEALKLDSTIDEACMLAGISMSSYYKHRDKNPDFARRMDIARQYPKLVARAAVQRRIRQWDAKTALRFLELREKNRYWENAIESSANNDKMKVEFTLIPTKKVEWADQQENDFQTSTNQSSAYEWFANSSDGENEKQTPWENEDGVLERLAS